MKGRAPLLSEAQSLSAVSQFNAGKPAADIAREFGVGRHIVYKLLGRHGLQPSKNQQYPVGKPKEASNLMAMPSEALAVRLYLSGLSQQQVAADLGVSQAWVSRQLTAAGVERRGHKRAGAAHGAWKGGRIKVDGYWRVWLAEDDPMRAVADASGYALEHRLMMSRHLGRPLRQTETVHHIDGDRGNNRISNLQLRQGQHGNGVALRCRCCGSTDLEPVQLEGH